MVFREVIAFYSDNYTNTVTTHCGEIEFLIV
jgi:hypothetical protein